MNREFADAKVDFKGIAAAPECMDASKIDWQSMKGLAAGAGIEAMQAGAKAVAEKFLPDTSIIGDLSKAKLNDVVKDLQSFKDNQKVSEAADLIAGDPALASKHARDTVTKLFEEAEKKGPGAVAKLVDDLNKQLEGSGHSVYYKPTHVPFSVEAGKVRIVNDGNQIISELSVTDTNSPYLRGAH
jgi:hypothetical protein